MRLKASLAVVIGAVSGFVGITMLAIGVFDDLLPVNRLLGAMISSLLVMWGLLRAARAWRGQ